jgi:hypothetical protein
MGRKSRRDAGATIRARQTKKTESGLALVGATTLWQTRTSEPDSPKFSRHEQLGGAYALGPVRKPAFWI